MLGIINLVDLKFQVFVPFLLDFHLDCQHLSAFYSISKKRSFLGYHNNEILQERIYPIKIYSFPIFFNDMWDIKTKILRIKTLY